MTLHAVDNRTTYDIIGKQMYTCTVHAELIQRHAEWHSFCCSGKFLLNELIICKSIHSIHPVTCT